jgi:hypothetical protein
MPPRNYGLARDLCVRNRILLDCDQGLPMGVPMSVTEPAIPTRRTLAEERAVVADVLWSLIPNQFRVDKRSHIVHVPGCISVSLSGGLTVNQMQTLVAILRSIK